MKICIESNRALVALFSFADHSQGVLEGAKRLAALGLSDFRMITMGFFAQISRRVVVFVFVEMIDIVTGLDGAPKFRGRYATM